MSKLRSLTVAAVAFVASTANAEPKGRDVTYHMGGDGLHIEVDGVELSPKATPVKTDLGWIVSLSVRAVSRDAKKHNFLAPEHGALMVAAEADRGGKKPFRHHYLMFEPAGVDPRTSAWRMPSV